MTSLLFVWYVLTIPTDRLLCTLWVGKPPTPAEMVAACGFTRLMDYRLDVFTLKGDPACSTDATSLLWIMDVCDLEDPLDQYYMRIIQPNYQTIFCSFTTESADMPAPKQIAVDCPGYFEGLYIVELAGTLQQADLEPAPVCQPPDVPDGPTLYDQPALAGQLYTDEQLTWLAGELIWYGIVKPDCPGGTSGLDPYTLAANPCGEAFAHATIILWQNQFNDDIYAAAVLHHIPARLLKRMMMVESQMWPLYSGPAGETGIMQVTDNGADVLLRYDPDINPYYSLESEDLKYWSRLAMRNEFACSGCGLTATLDHIRNMLPMYARLLAAYRCRAVSINPVLFGADAWRQAVVDYNGSEDYLWRVEMQ